MDPIERWHAFVDANDFSGLDDLLAEDAVFLSPAAPQPQQGRERVVGLLRAAMSVLNNDAFKYVSEWRADRSAVLEFEGVVEGAAFSGVDIIHWNEAGRITRFVVMLRPIMALGPVMPKIAEAMRALA